MNTPTQITDLVNRGALFVVNHSGGKDSQAMLIEMLKVVPAHLMVVVHADLGRVEWHGAKELAAKQAADAGIPFRVALPIFADGSTKGFLEMVERNFINKPQVPSFPSADCRQCTSDLKRGPIEKIIKAYAKQLGTKLIVNCQGIRALESDDRAERTPFVHLNTVLSEKTGKPKSALCAAGREVYEWLPIFELTTEQVFATIRAAGQEPHWAYARNERLSCVFCIMGKPVDILHGSIMRPELFAEYVAMEERTGYTLQMNGKSLLQIVADAKAKGLCADLVNQAA